MSGLIHGSAQWEEFAVRGHVIADELRALEARIWEHNVVLNDTEQSLLDWQEIVGFANVIQWRVKRALALGGLCLALRLLQGGRRVEGVVSDR